MFYFFQVGLLGLQVRQSAGKPLGRLDQSITFFALNYFYISLGTCKE